MNFVKSKFLALAAVAGFVVSAAATNATIPSATSTLDTLGGVIINTIIDFATVIFTTYWPYALLTIILSGLIGLAYKIAHLGSGGAKR